LVDSCRLPRRLAVDHNRRRAAPEAAAVDAEDTMVSILMKMDGVAGNGGPHGWLNAENVAMSQVHRDEVAVTRVADAMSPKFIVLHAQGISIPKVVIEVHKGGRAVWRIELSNVFVSGIQIAGGHPPREQISMNFASVKSLAGLGLAAASALTGGLAGAAARL
jgi:hypothetical protein